MIDIATKSDSLKAKHADLEAHLSEVAGFAVYLMIDEGLRNFTAVAGEDGRDMTGLKNWLSSEPRFSGVRLEYVKVCDVTFLHFEI